MGRMREPTAVLAMKGSKRAKSRAKTEATAPAGCPLKPATLSPAASATWDSVVDSLDMIGTLHRTDGAAIARYCQLTDQWEAAVRESDVNTMAKLAPLLLRIEQHFGLTPSARAGLATAPKKTNEETEARYFG